MTMLHCHDVMRNFVAQALIKGGKLPCQVWKERTDSQHQAVRKSVAMPQGCCLSAQIAAGTPACNW